MAVLAISLILPTTIALAASCSVTSVWWNSTPTNTNQFEGANTCNTLFSTLSVGDAFTVGGSSYNNGTWHFASWNATGGGWSNGSVEVQESSWTNPGTHDTGTVTFASVSASSSTTTSTSSIASTSEIAVIGQLGFNSIVIFFISLLSTVWLSRTLMQ